MKSIHLLFRRVQYECNLFIQIGLYFFVPSIIGLIIFTLLGTDFSTPTDNFVVTGLYVNTGYTDLGAMLMGMLVFSILTLCIGTLIYVIRRFRKKPITLHQKQWAYTLEKINRKLYLSVLCGTSAQYEKTIQLTQKQRESFWLYGYPYIASLASDIAYSPTDNQYTNQYVEKIQK